MTILTENTVLATPWVFHTEHAELIAETHARPAQPISSPARIIHMAFRCSEAVSDEFFAVLAKDSEPNSLRHIVSAIGKTRIKLEKHTEFISCTLFQEIGNERNVEDLRDVLNENFPMPKIEILVLLELTLVKTLREVLKALPDNERMYGGKIRDAIDVRSSFVPDETGTIHFTLCAGNVTRDELGRRIQRLLEMETYRTMSLMGLQVARRIGQEISACETKLETLTRDLRNNTDGNALDDEALFKQLSDLSEQNTILQAETRYRFAASRAYFALFQQRTDSLEEVKVGDVQTMSGFLRSRIEPAMATIESTAKRQQSLTDDLSRAIVLLRTRIELNLNRGNQELLKSMDDRHDQQLKISQTVEGLSIIAITYYAVGLVSYFLKALAAQPFVPFSEKLLTAASVPFVFIVVFLSLRRIRKAWEARKSN